MKKLLRIESNGIGPLFILVCIFAFYVFITLDGYKLFNQANSNKYNPKKSQYYHK